MSRCLNLELKPWEMLITSADTVHFGSRFPNECISGNSFRGTKTHHRLHHYLGSQDMLKSVEQAWQVFEDCAYNKSLRKCDQMIVPGTASDAAVVSIQFQDYTFNLRSHADMAQVFHKMRKVPHTLEPTSIIIYICSWCWCPLTTPTTYNI